LLGLPVPGVFFATERETNKLLVIDGQQRLKTLQFFLAGAFNPKPEEKKQTVFKLTEVLDRFKDRTYKTLDERDRIRLDNSVIHATIIKQQSPPNGDTSIYHIFERLNSGGRRLAPQEIRCAIYHGPLINLLRTLNDNASWREIFGKPAPRLKDQELILRFLAFYFGADKYSRPMADFLSSFAAKHQNADKDFVEKASRSFQLTVGMIKEALGHRAFRPQRAINAAVFDSVMYGLAHRMAADPTPDPKTVAARYDALLKDSEYVEAVSRSTADEAFVSRRLLKAKETFAGA